MAISRVKRRLILQQDTSQTKQSVRYTAQRAALRVTAAAESNMASFAYGIMVGSGCAPNDKAVWRNLT